MALTIVQATGKVRRNDGGALRFTFSTPPSVGNAVLVLVSNRRSAGPSLPASFTDSQGNSYTRSASLTVSTQCAGVYCCSTVVTSGTPFVIDINAGGGLYAGAALEVSGVGSSLTLDQSATASGSGTTVSSGNTAALTASEALLCGVHTINLDQASITVEALSPAWTEQFEELSFTNYTASEGDTRILSSGAAGTTPRAQWTVASSGTYVAVIAAFAGPGGGGAVARTDSFLWMPV